MLRLAVGNGVPKMGWQVDVSPQTLGFLLPTGGQQWLLSTVVSGDGRSVVPPLVSVHFPGSAVAADPTLHIPASIPGHPTPPLGGSDPALGGTGTP